MFTSQQIGATKIRFANDMAGVAELLEIVGPTGQRYSSVISVACRACMSKFAPARRRNFESQRIMWGKVQTLLERCDLKEENLSVSTRQALGEAAAGGAFGQGLVNSPALHELILSLESTVYLLLFERTTRGKREHRSEGLGIFSKDPVSLSKVWMIHTRRNICKRESNL